MRLAWFSPLPPVRSGIAAYSADLLPRLGHQVDCFVDLADGRPGDPTARNAHDFVWAHQLRPYDLVVYQLGNAPCHDYMWAYMAAYPGLVVLHDARLHQARARRLLNQERFDDYRREFWFDQPTAPPGFAEYAVEGLGGPIYYLWPMHRAVLRAARLVAVHNPRVAAWLEREHPGTPVRAIRMGVEASTATEADGVAVRADLGLPSSAVVFAVFGKATPAKRIGPILTSLGALASEGLDAHVLLVGDTDGYPTLTQELAAHGLGHRVHVTGYVADADIGRYLAAADACLCLRWPTALESSASWLQCLAARRATVITELAHQVDIPTLDPLTRQPSGPGTPIALGIDLLREGAALTHAMRLLTVDPALRTRVAEAGHAWWQASHTLDHAAADYARVIEDAAATPPRPIDDLPAHFRLDGVDATRETAKRYFQDLDILE